jgi:AGZA family xanthine/uracil permease-like MFS transporter
MLERLFHLRERNTSVRTELLAGLTTFMTMAYIVVVNPLILKDAGMPAGPVMVATALSAAIATIFMGVFANMPFALASGMGLNAFFTYTVVLGMGLSWQAALAAMFVDGVITMLLSVTKVREAVFNSIPKTLKLAISCGIGLFIALIGLVNVKLIVANPATLVSLGSIKSPEVILALFGLVLTIVLVALKVRGAFLISIFTTSIVGILTHVVPMPTGIASFVSMPPSIAPVFGQFRFGFKELIGIGVLPMIFSFTFVDLFDTLGTFMGVATKANMLDKDGKLINGQKALIADSLGTIIGSTLGTSGTTTYVESASGVAQGGRTGLASVFTGIFFVLTIFFAPFLQFIPWAATGPVLIVVGVFMMEPIVEIDFSNYLEAIPAFLAIVMMPFAYSIAEGIIWGVLAYAILHVAAGKWRDISPTMAVLALLFVAKLIWF